jgi:outer membrane lipoprotein-sorting protein
MRWRSVILAVVLAAGACPALTVDELVAKSRQVLDGVKDFTCTMTFSVRAPDVRVPDTRSKILFKQPDKCKAKPLDGDFAVLPRVWRMAVGQVLARLAETHRLTLLREEEVQDRRQGVLKAEPKQEDREHIAYHLLWVDAERGTLTRVRTYPRQGTPVNIDLSHTQRGKAWLPERVVAAGREPKAEGKGDEEVRVTLRFGDYRVNVGLSDDEFK